MLQFAAKQYQELEHNRGVGSVYLTGLQEKYFMQSIRIWFSFSSMGYNRKSLTVRFNWLVGNSSKNKTVCSSISHQNDLHPSWKPWTEDQEAALQILKADSSVLKSPSGNHRTSSVCLDGENPFLKTLARIVICLSHQEMVEEEAGSPLCVASNIMRVSLYKQNSGWENSQPEHPDWNWNQSTGWKACLDWCDSQKLP